MAEVWVVSTMVEDDDNIEYGPYTKAQAERVAARLCAEAETAKDDVGITFHPHGVTYATAYPLARYDQFLTTEEKREVRRDVRTSNKERNHDS